MKAKINDKRSRANTKALKVKTNLKAGWWETYYLYIIWRGGW